MVIAVPTNDGLTLRDRRTGRSAEFHRVPRRRRGRLPGGRSTWRPALAERVRAGRRAERFLGTGDLPNFFRRPYGPGWALVGDAGYHKDPIMAQGITDAFRDAELLAEAIDAGLAGRRPLERRAGRLRAARRDEAARPRLRVHPPARRPSRRRAPEMQALFGALRDNPE